MPKSKRNKQVELSKTKKRGLEWKKHLFEEVRTCVDSYTNVFVFSVNDMRNSKMKTVREQWRHSRFFIGKNKIMAMALGRFAEEEYKPNLHKIGQQIKGQRALLFSNKSSEEVLSWFRSYSEGDFARSGNTATETVKLVAGPLSQFPHSQEPYLRQLGLPTSLVKGVIHLVKDHEVCNAGDILTPETAKILKLLGYEMADFHITINCMWSQDGTFIQFTDDVDSDTKENLQKKKKKSNSFKVEETNKSLDTEEMEVENDDDEEVIEDKDDEVIEDREDDEVIEDSEDDEVPELVEDTSYSLPNIVAKKDVSSPSLPKLPSFNSHTSTPKEKSNNLEKDDVVEEMPIIASPKDVSEVDKETAKHSKKKKIEVVEEINSLKEGDTEIVVETPKNAKKVKSVEIPTIISPKEDDIESIKETPKNEKPPKNANNEEESSNRKSRSRKRKVDAKKAAAKNNSLLKTPDPNTSQDSPVFRELRNRSVKVTRKRKK